MTQRDKCPACYSPIPKENIKGYCNICGWEFITFLAPFEAGQKQLQERLEVAQNYTKTLQEGSEEIKQKMAQLEAQLKEKDLAVQELSKRNKELEVELDQAIIDQNYIASNRHFKGKKIKIEYGVDENGDLIIEIEERLFRLPTIMIVLKNGNIPVADPKFGTDGSYAAIIHPKLWAAVNGTLFILKNPQITNLFPCLSGKYTFSLSAVVPHYNLSRKGTESDLFNIQLNFH